MPSASVLLRLAQFSFWSLLIFTFVMAEIPPQHAIQLFPWDKAEHFTAFYVLTGVAAAAFPRRRLIYIAIALSAFGALIELVQALPFINRDCDIKDWIADTIAIAAALAPMALAWWRYEYYPAHVADSARLATRLER